MRHDVLSVYDVAAKAFGSPVTVPSLELGKRSFKDACMDPKTDFAKYPDSYVLYQLGTFDLSSGVLEPFTAPSRIISALEIVNS